MSFLPPQEVAAVARLLLGDENKAASKPKELRFGSRGSMTVDLEKATFYSMEEEAGGGLLDLIARETGKKGRDAFEWLEQHGFHVEERDGSSSTREPRQRANGGQGPNASGKASEPAQRAAAAPANPPIDLDKPDVTYDYLDESGALLFQVCRYKPKDFRQRRPDTTKPKGWNWSVKGVRQVPFNLPKLMEAIKAGDTVFVVEGEKDVLALAEWGVTATCNAGGAGKWPEGFEPFFDGADVVILPDNDPQTKKKRPDGTEVLAFYENGRPKYPGQDHASMVADRLMPVARRVRVLELPGLPSKGDFSDWKAAGGTADAFYELVDTRAVEADAYRTPAAEGPNPDRPDDPPWDGGELTHDPAPAPFVSRFNAVPWELLDAPGQEHEWLIKNVMTRGEVGMMAGASRAGKSFEALHLAMAICRGLPYWGNRVLQGGVAYQAGEGGKGIKKRIRAYRQWNGLSVTDKLPFVLLPKPVDLYGGGEDQTGLLIAECRHWSTTWSVPLELVVIDTLSAATPGADENSSKDIGPVLAKCARIAAELRCAVLLVHHLNAGGTKVRGHTSIMANLDSVIVVEKSEELKDADNRPIRQCKTTKQKDGEDGRIWRFVLRSVEIGMDQDGDPVTSCICAEPNMGALADIDTDRTPTERGARLSEQCLHFLGAIETALTEHGFPAPPHLRLPRHVQVVEFRHVRAAFIARDWDDLAAEDEKVEPAADTPASDEQKSAAPPTADAVRQAMARHGRTLVNRDIIGRKDKLVWLTGVKVQKPRRRAPVDPSPGPADARLDELI